MRLMLGTAGDPSLLVSAEIEYGDYTSFDFYVINGAWPGHYTDGYITINYNAKENDYNRNKGPMPWTTLDKVEILCRNQDRLRGDYQDVFANFDNPNYVAPPAKVIRSDYIDDDIPF